MAKVVLQHVTKKFGSLAAVDDLTLEVRDGEFFSLVGPSGCGKSTALRLIAGLEEPTSGDIYIGMTRVNKLLPYERDVAMVFESPTYALYPNMTAFDNMAFGLRTNKNTPVPGAAPEPSTPPEETHGHQPSKNEVREGAIRKRVEQIAGRLGLNDYLQRRRDQLSAGHSQSVALGRAMAREPQVFLMDDPLSQLDAAHRTANHKELRDLHQQLGVTIIYVTHDQNEAMVLSNRIGVMN